MQASSGTNHTVYEIYRQVQGTNNTVYDIYRQVQGQTIQFMRYTGKFRRQTIQFIGNIYRAGVVCTSPANYVNELTKNVTSLC